MKIPATRFTSVSVILASILMLSPGVVSAYRAPCLVGSVESKPVRLEELEFSVVTQDEWRAFRYWGSKFNADPDRQDEIPLQLRIVNRGSKSIVVPTFDSFTAMLKGPDGKELPLGKARDYTLATAPILLKPGQGYSYAMIARLVEPHDGDGNEFVFRDLPPGRLFQSLQRGENLHPHPRQSPRPPKRQHRLLQSGKRRLRPRCAAPWRANSSRR